MPLGVEHFEGGKELLGAIIPKPLMPLGVEHIFDHYLSANTDIPKPLMPLGVEHMAGLVCRFGRGLIPKPLMPLGVEHSKCAESLALRKDS